MKATLNDFEIKFKNIPLFCDNESVVKLTNNPVQHSRTKHIDFHHHFIRDHQQKGDISIENIGTDDQLADLFTKPLDETRFCKLRNKLNILDYSNMCWCTPFIWHASPSSNQGKSCLTWHTFFAKDMISASSQSLHVIGSIMKRNEFDACMVTLLFLCLTWSSGSIRHVYELVNLVFDLENEL
jgi:hypothetical protein